MAGLTVRKFDGTLLFDTNYITHGLLKSAYLVADETWPRKYLRSANLDPNNGASYDDSFRAGDQMFSISISDAINPICFIVGKGCLAGVARGGNTTKFLYSGASTSTKAYVFDRMKDTGGSPPFLKCRREDGTVSFNSLMTPLNIAYAIQAPGPAALDQFGKYSAPYNGGVWQTIRVQSASADPQVHNVADITLDGGVEYAVFLNYSRGCQGLWSASATGATNISVDMNEGAYGRSGGISFIFGPAGAGVQMAFNSLMSTPASVTALPTDRYPVALVVTTSALPFPFG